MGALDSWFGVARAQHVEEKKKSLAIKNGTMQIYIVSLIKHIKTLICNFIVLLHCCECFIRVIDCSIRVF